LIVHGYKYHCQTCARYFRQRFPGILPYQRATEPFKNEVCEAHHGGIPQIRLGRRRQLGTATIERWYHRFLERGMAERVNDLCPRMLGIDEHFFTRKDGYATTLCNLGKRKVFDVVLGRSEAALEGYLNQLTRILHEQPRRGARGAKVFLWWVRSGAKVRYDRL